MSNDETNEVKGQIFGLVADVVRAPRRAKLTHKELMEYKELIKDPNWYKGRWDEWVRAFSHQLADAIISRRERRE